MNNILSAIFNTEMYGSQVERLKATFVYSIVTMFFIAGVLVSIIRFDGDLSVIVVPAVSALAVVIVYAVVRSGRLNLGSVILVGSLFATLILRNIAINGILPIGLLFYAVIIMLSGLLLSVRITFVISILISIMTLVLSDVPSWLGEDNIPSRLSLVIIYVAMTGIIYAYNRSALVSRLEGADKEERERFKLAEVNMNITRNAAERIDLATALDSTLNIILENYPNLYHAQVFLIDEKGIQARLTASTGEVGQRLIEKGHSLAVGSLSVIGQTTLSREPVIATVNDKDSVHRVNQLLPETTLEVAFPLIVGDKIIGALDLQSKTLEELSLNDQQTYQSLANSLALAIDSIRQFEQSKARIEENQRLTEQTRNALREVERLNQRLIGRAWAQYTQNLGDDMGLAVDFEADTATNYLEWSESLLSATQNNHLVQEGNVIAVPLRVRGEPIGALEFELPSSESLSPEDIDLLLEVTERFGLAAENTRLLEESQRTAQRETLINQISSRFQSAQNVETTLTEAARSINETLNASKVLIRLGVPENLPKSANGQKDS